MEGVRWQSLGRGPESAMRNDIVESSVALEKAVASIAGAGSIEGTQPSEAVEVGEIQSMLLSTAPSGSGIRRDGAPALNRQASWVMRLPKMSLLQRGKAVLEKIPHGTFFVVSRTAVLSATAPLPPLQKLLADGWLKDGRLQKKDIYHDAAFRQQYVGEYLAVSHRWEFPDKPDKDGEQLRGIQAHLQENPGIKWVWLVRTPRRALPLVPSRPRPPWPSACALVSIAPAVRAGLLVSVPRREGRERQDREPEDEAPGCSVRCDASDFESALPWHVRPDPPRPRLRGAILDSAGGMAIDAGYGQWQVATGE